MNLGCDLWDVSAEVVGFAAVAVGLSPVHRDCEEPLAVAGCGSSLMVTCWLNLNAVIASALTLALCMQGRWAWVACPVCGGPAYGLPYLRVHTGCMSGGASNSGIFVRGHSDTPQLWLQAHRAATLLVRSNCLLFPRTADLTDCAEHG